MVEKLEQKSELELFRDKIADLKRQEIEKGKTIHLRLVKPEELTEDDRRIYEKWERGELTVPELNAYRNELSKGDQSAYESRGSLLGYISHLIMRETWKTEFNREPKNNE